MAHINFPLMAKKLVIPLAAITFIASNILDAKSSPDVADQRLKKLVALYEDSSRLYNSEGPLSFWSSFAFLANKKEIDFLMEGTKGYPDLPQIKRSAFKTIEITSNEKVLAKVVVLDFDKQVFSINDKTIKIPLGASIEEIVKSFEKQFLIANHQKTAWENFLKDFSILKMAHAFNKRSTASPSAKKGFFARLFGAGAHSYNGVPSTTDGTPNTSIGSGPSAHGGAVAAGEGFDPEATPTREPIPTPSPLPNSPLAKLPDSYRIPKGLELNNSTQGCNLIIGRHGNKEQNQRQHLTEDLGVKQAADLAIILSEFERNYKPIDLIFSSDIERSKQTAKPFKDAKKYSNSDRMHQVMGVLVRECIGDVGCKREYEPEEVKDAFPKGVPPETIPAFLEYFNRDVCKDGKTIFISGHGSFITKLFSVLKIKSPTGHQEARPHVLTFDGNGTAALKYPEPK